MDDLVQELRNDAMRLWLPNSERRRRATVVAAADHIVALEAERAEDHQLIEYLEASAARYERMLTTAGELLRQFADVVAERDRLEEAKAAGKEPWVCVFCSVADGSWPCDTRMTVDDALRAAGSTDSSTP